MDPRFLGAKLVIIVNLNSSNDIKILLRYLAFFSNIKKLQISTELYVMEE